MNQSVRPYPQFNNSSINGRHKLLFFISWCIVTLFALLEPGAYFSAIFSIITFFYVGFWVSKKSTLQMMFYLGYCTFIFLPALLNWHYLGTDFELFYLSSFVAIFFLFSTRKTDVKFFYDYGNKVRVFYFCILFFSVLLIAAGFGYARAFFPFVMVFFALSLREKKLFSNFMMFFALTCMFAIFMAYAWSGFGRIVVFGWLILAVLIFLYSVRFYPNKYFFSLLPGLASPLLTSRDILSLNFSGFEAALRDSAFGPYRLASGFINQFHHLGLDVPGFLDQIMFTFFVFIPRGIWTSKPYGFGFEYTVQHLDYYLVDAGHSIASTLIGDHIYYLGYFGIITSCLVFWVIAYFSRILYRLKGLNGNGILLFSASAMVLSWGGMTSFSARVVMASIIFIALYFIVRPFLARSVKI